MRITLEHVARRLLPKVAPGRALASAEWVTLTRVAEVLLEGAPHGITPAETADNVEKFLLAGRSRRAWRVRVLLQLIEHLPLATEGRTFTTMSRERRRALIERRWVGGRHVWRICAKVRNLVILGAYSDSRVAARTGYVPLHERPRFRHLRPTASSSSTQASEVQ
jgi:hypothetical protein